MPPTRPKARASQDAARRGRLAGVGGTRAA